MTEWNVEQAKDEIANGGRYGAKRVMEAVYRNNIDVFRHWGYRLPGGRLVGLDEPEFKDKFRAVVFAILEGRGSARHPIEEKGKFAPFYATFGRWTKVQ